MNRDSMFLLLFLFVLVWYPLTFDRGKHIEALRILLRSAPAGTKNQNIKVSRNTYFYLFIFILFIYIMILFSLIGILSL